MNFVDGILLTLSNASSAAAVFDEASLKAVVTASYGVPRASLIGTPVPRFDALEFAPFAGCVNTETLHDGYSVSQVNALEQSAPGLNARTDILWRGAVTVTSALERAEVGVARASAPDLNDIDADIPAPVPSNAAALEAARRAVMLERLRTSSQNPQSVSDVTLDAWLAEAGLPNVTRFLEQAAAAAVPMTQFVLSFTPLPGSAAPAMQSFPIAAALMIRDISASEFRLTDLLQATRQVQTRLRIEGIVPKDGDAALPRGRPATLWLVAQDWFDDADWPGGGSGNAAARRSDRIVKATDWLAAQGVALVPVAG